MNYCAIIGDIVGSKNIKNRKKVQEQFQSVIQMANDQYDAYIASYFTITLGDEFQGLLYTPSICFDVIDFIKEKMKPVDLVFGIGVGSMETSFSKTVAIGSDGPAYWYARKMVEKAKLKKPSICFFSDSPEDELINALILFTEACTQSQTKRQQEVVGLYKELGSQYKVAEKLKISQSAVSVTLQKALFKEIEHSQKVIKRFLEEKWA
ncbi:hypothetical protein J2S00_000158 [Caldalkalibacillus uzonensis]|uniref:SatD n=1 Tax=Caldalkalibacillus uzonensis TaxID=353224 RepID=A0ABU0CLU6_9BACI|nr:SatD family protein [Caldalkalibacillus uzonensis]MDQ0337388.1 hypothetical protein [Caldalkalibacillus uzonensis]